MEYIVLFIGIILAPRFTLGCMLFHYDYELLGLMAIIYGIAKDELEFKRNQTRIQ